MQKSAHSLPAQPFYVTRLSPSKSTASLQFTAHAGSAKKTAPLAPVPLPRPALQQLLLPGQQFSQGVAARVTLDLPLQARQLLLHLPAAQCLHTALGLIPAALQRFFEQNLEKDPPVSFLELGRNFRGRS